MGLWEFFWLFVAVCVIVAVLEELYLTPIKRELEHLRKENKELGKIVIQTQNNLGRVASDLRVIAEIVNKFLIGDDK